MEQLHERAKKALMNHRLAPHFIRKAVPEGHLFRLPILIPPHLSQTLWFIIEMDRDHFYKQFRVSVGSDLGLKSFRVKDPNFYRDVDVMYRKNGLINQNISLTEYTAKRLKGEIKSKK